jgi:outer membrane protein OmpA-like peptidoglycan-associated protein
VPGGQQRNKAQRKTDEAGSADTSASGSASLLITFDTNATTVSQSSIAALDKLARALKSDQLVQYKFDIEGHADPRGSAEENLRLSQGRAESVIDYLVAKHSLDGNRLRAVGKGDREPLNTRDPSAPENRRVTVRNQAGQ